MANGRRTRGDSRPSAKKPGKRRGRRTNAEQDLSSESARRLRPMMRAEPVRRDDRDVVLQGEAHFIARSAATLALKAAYDAVRELSELGTYEEGKLLQVRGHIMEAWSIYCTALPAGGDPRHLDGSEMAVEAAFAADITPDRQWRPKHGKGVEPELLAKLSTWGVDGADDEYALAEADGMRRHDAFRKQRERR